MIGRIPEFKGDRMHVFLGVRIADLTRDEAIEVIHHLGGTLQRSAADGDGLIVKRSLTGEWRRT